MTNETTGEGKEPFEYYFRKAATYLDVGISEMPSDRIELRKELKLQVDKFLQVIGLLLAADRRSCGKDDLISLGTDPGAHSSNHTTSTTANSTPNSMPNSTSIPGFPITHLSQLNVPQPRVNRLFLTTSSETTLPPIGTPRSTRADSTSSAALSQNLTGSDHGGVPLRRLEHGLAAKTTSLAKVPPTGLAPIGTRPDGSIVSSPTLQHSMKVLWEDQIVQQQDKKTQLTPTDTSDKHEATYASAAKGPGNMNVAATLDAKLEHTPAPFSASPPQSDQRHVAFSPPTPSVETPAQQLRMVLIHGLSSNTKLANVTALIGSDVGAVKSITLADDSHVPDTRTAVVTFHHASFAQSFMEKQAVKADSKVKVKLGNPVPADSELRRMDVPEGVRRRLTVTGKGLFFGPNPEQAIRRYLSQYVNDSSIETVFVHNAGNATAVFATVGHALIAFEILNKAGKNSKHKWHGMKATFSKDPCEHLMRLVKSPPPLYLSGGTLSHGVGRGGSGVGRGRNTTTTPLMRRRVRGS